MVGISMHAKKNRYMFYVPLNFWIKFWKFWLKCDPKLEIEYILYYVNDRICNNVNARPSNRRHLFVNYV